MIVIVCGGRDYDDADAVWLALSKAHVRRPITKIVEGGAAGADRWARLWAYSEEIPCVTVQADWKRYGPAAGPIRNKQMLTDMSPDGVIAFPGGKGTRDMCQQAEQAGVKVWRPYG